MVLPKLTLTYFAIEGKAEPLRLAFLLGNIPFEDEKVAFSDWKDLKPKTPFGQLPMLTIDKQNGSEPFVCTQSLGLLRIIGKEYAPDLYSDIFAVEEAMGVVDEFSAKWAPAFAVGMSPKDYGRPEDTSKTDEGKALIKSMRERFVKEELPHHVKSFEKLLARHGNTFLASKDKPSIADCYAVVTLRQFTRGHIDYVPTTCLDEYPIIVDYIKRFCALSEIKKRYVDGIH